MTDVYPRALFLDLDGTLADSLPVMRAVYHAFLAEQSRAGDDAEFESLNGPALPEIVATLRGRHSLSASAEALQARYRALIVEKYAAEARPAPGASELLAAASRLGIPAWVVTSAERAIAERFLAAHDLLRLVAGVVTADGLEHGKPDPSIYLRALAEARLRPEEVWAVEDSPNGARAATAAGIMTFVVADKPLGAPNLRRLSSLSALLPLLADCTVEPIGGDLRILVSGGEPPMSDELLQRIERLWHEERREHPNRFDGTLLSFAGRSVEGVLGRFVPYRFYLAKRRDAALPLKITPLAVTGALLCDGRIAFARRAEGTTQYPGRLELVPSGGIDADTLRADGSIDHRAQLIRELTEETGIPASAIIRFETIALLHDRVDDVIDVASLIEVEASAGAVAEATLRDGTAEYRSLRWVPLTDLGAFLEQHHAELIPSSRALGDLLARRG